MRALCALSWRADWKTKFPRAGSCTMFHLLLLGFREVAGGGLLSLPSPFWTLGRGWPQCSYYSLCFQSLCFDRVRGGFWIWGFPPGPICPSCCSDVDCDRATSAWTKWDPGVTNQSHATSAGAHFLLCTISKENLFWSLSCFMCVELLIHPASWYTHSFLWQIPYKQLYLFTLMSLHDPLLAELSTNARV